jgi:hypothetical protein
MTKSNHCRGRRQNRITGHGGGRAAATQSSPFFREYYLILGVVRLAPAALAIALHSLKHQKKLNRENAMRRRASGIRKVVNKDELKPGTKIFVAAAKKQPDGTLQTPRITYGRNGAGPAF